MGKNCESFDMELYSISNTGLKLSVYVYSMRKFNEETYAPCVSETHRPGVISANSEGKIIWLYSWFLEVDVRSGEFCCVAKHFQNSISTHVNGYNYMYSFTPTYCLVL